MTFETLTAHFRPRPAIPGVLVLVLGLMIALPAAGRPEVGALVAWGVPLALVGSAGLALAAGFCSFFPPIAWLAVIALAAKPLLAIDAPGIPVALSIGALLALAALGIQAWRVATGRFVPTIEPR
jgi:hypothetical protein